MLKLGINLKASFQGTEKGSSNTYKSIEKSGHRDFLVVRVNSKVAWPALDDTAEVT